MQVPRSAYDGLTDAINDLSGKSRELFDARFRDGLSAFVDAGGAVPPENVAALREFAIGLLDDVGGAAAEVAYSYGAEFYDAARAAAVGSPLHATPAPPNPHAANVAAVKGMIETVAKTGQVEPFAAACAARVDYVARKSCGDAVVQCAAKDPRKPRFARVPQGGETCRFCLMLASRGAVYLTEHKAGAVNHYHANCDCKVVPDFGDGIEGYDPSVYYDRYRAMLEGHELEEHYELLERYGRTTKRLYKTAAYDYKKALGAKGKSSGNARRHETERAAVSLKASSVRIRYEGSFGGATVDARKAYAASDASPSELFGLRMGVRVETQGDFSKLGKAKHAAMYTGMEHACETLGYPPGKIRLVSAQSLKSSYAEARRRSDGVTVHVDPSKLAKLSEDEIEQIVFHEVAHGKEYEGLSDAQFDIEAKRLARFQAGEIAKLSASTASKRLEKCLIDAGIQAVYKPFDGRMVFSGASLTQLKRLPKYAWRDAAKGMQDSELIAESLRFVANNGYGINNVADAIAAEFGGTA